MKKHVFCKCRVKKFKFCLDFKKKLRVHASMRFRRCAFECPMSAKSKFLVIDINSMYYHTPKVVDKHWLYFKKCKKRVNVFLGKFPKWDFKRNILDVTLMHRNQCIKLCPQKCKMGKLTISFQWMSSEELKCSPVNSSKSFMESWNINFNQKFIFFSRMFFVFKNSHVTFCSEALRWGLMKAYLQYLSKDAWKSG